ncbi:uncharacterized protein LOC115216396 [Octopus sinensis]|uniref:Uncharacterized protein LOC115216396 n=1 Tax=Octopus sinensis TaxID=2607531 RepID=A0A6P7STF5_9MOLL|nr:uncharacterized protein LOC115216396 [Octopus sinensis]XP_029641552.1 uncharacterized protein LOC115216396 [Octopus sinensis]XP_029641553.1 uncharacterized protein LOC115216396 [Octopus sinensis]
MSKDNPAPELLLEGYEVYDGPKGGDNDNLLITNLESLAPSDQQSHQSDSQSGFDSLSNDKQNLSPKVSNSSQLVDSVVENQSDAVDSGENQDPLLEIKKMKGLLEQLIAKTEASKATSDVVNTTETTSVTQQSTPSKKSSSDSQDANTFPPTEDSVSFPVNSEATAQVTKATKKSIAQLKYKGHNIAGTILRPKSPTRNCSIPEKDKTHFPSALMQMDVKEDAATKVLRVQKHEVICALGAPVLFRSHSGMFVSNIDLTYYWCNFCPFKTDDKNELSQHIISHRFHCKHCSYQSFSRADVINHSSNVHVEFQETSVSLKYYALLPDYLQVCLFQSDDSSVDRHSMKGSQVKKSRNDYDSYLLSYDDEKNKTRKLRNTGDKIENGQTLIVHPASSPKRSLLMDEPSTSKKKSIDSDNSKHSRSQRKRKKRNSVDSSDDDNDDDDDDNVSLSSRRSLRKNEKSDKKQSKSTSSSDSSSSDSDEEAPKNLMEIYECNSCEFKSKEMQKVREHMFRIHPGGKFYCIDKRIRKNKAKRYIFFCCKNKCPFQSTDPITYTQHVDRCTPLPVIAPNLTKTSKPTGLQMTVQFAKKCLKKTNKSDGKKSGKKSKVEEDYGCHYCKFETDSLISVKNHLNMSHAKNSFVVRDLKAVDSLMSFLYLCKYCAWYSRDYSKLKNHMDREHRIPEKKLMVATNSAEAKKMAEEKKNKALELSHHESNMADSVVEESVAPVNADDISYRCYRCDFYTASVETIKIHLTTAHPKCNLTAFTCKGGSLRTIQFCPQADCYFMSTFSSEMERHKILNHNIPDMNVSGSKKVCYVQAYKCLSCNNTIATSLEDMKLHYFEQHPNVCMMVRDCVAFDLQKPSQLYLCDYGDCLFNDLDYKKFLFHNVAHEGGIVYECVHCNDWVSKNKEDYDIHVAALGDLEHNLMESTVEMDRSGSITRRLGDVVVKFEEP